jgi:glycosyltransferase involved in cell wall biosynthesis
MPPRVSIIVTVYKRTEYLAEALDSVMAQSYPDYEVVVADDSGTAASRQIVGAHGSLPRLRYVANPATMGVSASLVGAVRLAQGEFIAILNDDDAWESDLLAELVPPLLADESRAMAFSDHWVMDEAGRVDRTHTEEWSSGAGRLALEAGVVARSDEFCVKNGGFPVATSAVFRKDAIDWSLVVPEVSGAYDYWISFLLAASGSPIYYVPKRLARYRIHSTMETLRRSHDKGENLVYIFATLRKRGCFREFDDVLRRKLSDALFAVGRDKLYFNRAREARSHFCRCFFLTYRLGALLRVFAAYLPRQVRAHLVDTV